MEHLGIIILPKKNIINHSYFLILAIARSAEESILIPKKKKKN
jgi:hypothetical protein